jgi:hypothetical protein
LASRACGIGFIAAGLLCAQLAQAGNFAAFRYDDNFTDQQDQDGLYAHLKYIGLGEPNRYLSFGGDLRERAEYYSHTNLGPRAANYDGLLLHRFLLHADAHWDQARLFVQLGNHEQTGREPQAKPTDIDHLDVQQLFVDYRITLGDDTVTLRGGRQELAFGASRLIAVREGPNIHIDFDGAQIQFNSAGWKISTLAVRPVETKPAQFDDRANREQSLWGIYAVHKAADGAHFSSDFYYFGSINDDITFTATQGRERRNTFGTRWYGTSGGFDGDIELILQNGDIASKDIRAFAMATDSGWTWRDLKWKPRFGLRTDVISGDRNPADGTLGTFNALYPSGSYFSEASIVAQTNLLDFSASLAIKPSPKVTLTWSVNPLWRYSTKDALYTLPLAPLIAGNSSGARYIGTQNQLLGIWQYNEFISFKAALVRFEAGEFVTKGGGRDIDYAQFATIFRF